MSRPRPRPPRPELIRRPQESFGWLETCLLHEGILADIGPETTAVLLLLALAADEMGASYYGRGRMGAKLGMDQASVSRALERLLDQRLVAFRPWGQGQKDGVWQLLPVPGTKYERQGTCLPLADVLLRLGFGKRGDGNPKPPKSRAF